MIMCDTIMTLPQVDSSLRVSAIAGGLACLGRNDCAAGGSDLDYGGVNIPSRQASQADCWAKR